MGHPNVNHNLKSTTNQVDDINHKDVKVPDYKEPAVAETRRQKDEKALAEVMALLNAGKLKKAGLKATEYLESKEIDSMDIRAKLSVIEDRHNPDFEKNRVKKEHKKSTHKGRTFDMSLKRKDPTDMSEKVW